MPLLTWDAYHEKTLGCWMGKNAGGTLGGPVEGRKEILALDWYPKLQEGGIPNDDLEVQLVWLHMLETRGIGLRAKDLSEAWLDHYLPNWCEYGFGKTNLRKGLLPPLSGAFNNWFSESMGCPIRSEIWACVAPGLPVVAAGLAREDGIVDHTNESVYAEMLFAVIESAAYLTDDREVLIDLGLAAIPDDCRTALAVRTLRATWNRTNDWTATRQAVLDAVGSYADFTDAPQNIAFTLLGWYAAPDDFGQAICAAVNCGFDTDCTGATLGSILGIARGANWLPGRWLAPLGEAIAIDARRTRVPNPPATVHELTDRTAAVAVAVLAQQGIVFAPGRSLDLPLPSPEELRHEIQKAGLWYNPPNAVEHAFHHGRVMVEYPNGPGLAPGATNTAVVQFRNSTERRLEGPVAAVGMGPGLSAEIHPDGIDLGPGEEVELQVSVSLAADAPPRCHVEAALALQLENISPRLFPVSFVRPMVWHMAHQKAADGKLPERLPAEVDGKRFGIEGNIVPLPKPGLWLGRTRVLNPSRHERPVRICTPSNFPVRVWLNGGKVVDNPGAELIMPSYHANAAHHYGAGVLRPGWNEVHAAWLVTDMAKETHFFLTDPDGRGWGDLVFEP